MKRMMLLLLSLLLIPCVGAAEMLDEYLAAPKNVTDVTFSTATGISEFEINAEVEVPQIEYQPIKLYEVGLRSFSDSEIEAIARAVEVDPALIEHTVFEPETPWQNYYEYHIVHSNVQFCISNVFHQLTKLPIRSLFTYYLTRSKNTPDFGVFQHSWPLEIGVNCDEETLKTATDLATEIAKQIAPELSLNHIGLLKSFPTVMANAKAPPDMTNLPTGIQFDYTRVLDGIPVTHTMMQGSGGSEFVESYTEYFFQYEWLGIGIADDGLVSASYESPTDIKGVWKEDCGEMLSFPQVLEIAKAMLPLKYASDEWSNLERAEYNIHRIVFGYTRVMMPSEPDRFILIPVWDFIGEWQYIYDDGEHVGRPYDPESLLTINAVNGTVIDRILGY